MSTKLKVYANEDDTLLFWSIPQPIPGCRGFAIERKRTAANGQKTQGFLNNRIGFENEAPPADAAEGQPAVLKSSTDWPFQRFAWTDHEVGTGDTVQYRVVPMIRNAAGKLDQNEANASDWSEERTLGHNGDSKYQPFFNRGFVMSQFMARYLAENHLTLPQFKERISDEDDKTIREFLSGDLRLALLKELKTAKDEGGTIFAALFELSDEELLGALCALKGRANVVLANGSITAAKGEHAADARKRDENKDARARLLSNGVRALVAETDRFLSPGALGHNKFMVRTDKNGNPLTVWTGSTNWAPTGLCTQVNNGILINDPAVAKVYLDQWHALKDAKSLFPKPFVANNSKPKPVGEDVVGTVRSVVWFSRTSKGADMDALRAEVEKAREGILFLMFMPGASGLFKDVSERAVEPNLFVRGVVSELPNGINDPSAVDVSLVDGRQHQSLHLDVIQPEGIQHPMAHFAEEVTRKQFLSSVGHAIIHSKVVVIDPFGPDPVVITGSHNFSGSASTKNDENFIIIKGDPALAEAYAVNVMGAYDHYSFRALLAKTNQPFNGLKDNDTWQAPKLAANRRTLRFWGV